MSRRATHSLTLAWLLVCACGGSSSPARVLHVGVEPEPAGTKSAPAAAAVTTPTSTPIITATGMAGTSGSAALEELQVEFHDPGERALSHVEIPCDATCVKVVAVPRGGNPPYAITWQDGSHERSREVCPGAADGLEVTVTDTARVSAEFQHAMQRAHALLRVEMASCPSTPPRDQSGSEMCRTLSSDACDLAPNIHLPEDLTVDVKGATQQHFAHGARLPAGRYRLEYVTGCSTFGDMTTTGWTVHASAMNPGLVSCFLISNDQSILGLTPGTIGARIEAAGAFATYQACVAANCKLSPNEFDFAGGTLGVQRDGGGVIGAIDDVPGEAVGGKSPTFRLSLVDCP